MKKKMQLVLCVMIMVFIAAAPAFAATVGEKNAMRSAQTQAAAEAGCSVKKIWKS